MTRKDYILIAKAIRDASEETRAVFGPDAHEVGTRKVADYIADALAQDNPRFDAQRFLTACGYGATSMN